MSESKEILTQLDALVLAFQTGRLSLPVFATELESGIQSLPSSLEKTKNELFSKWMVVEEVNALALDAGQYLPLPEHAELIKQSLLEVHDLVSEAKKVIDDT